MLTGFLAKIGDKTIRKLIDKYRPRVVMAVLVGGVIITLAIAFALWLAAEILKGIGG